jgi:hypothetical protein
LEFVWLELRPAATILPSLCRVTASVQVASGVTGVGMRARDQDGAIRLQHEVARAIGAVGDVGRELSRAAKLLAASPIPADARLVNLSRVAD